MMHGIVNEVYTDYFCEEENRFYVDCYWEVDDENLDADYAVGDDEDEYSYRRGASMAFVSADGSKVEYRDEFKEVCLNSSLIQECINVLCDELKSNK